jgi:hypothetical protein
VRGWRRRCPVRAGAPRTRIACLQEVNGVGAPVRERVEDLLLEETTHLPRADEHTLGRVGERVPLAVGATPAKAVAKSPRLNASFADRKAALNCSSVGFGTVAIMVVHPAGTCHNVRAGLYHMAFARS